MPLLPVLSLILVAGRAPADDFQTFAKNDATIGKGVYDKPTAVVDENLGILVDHILRAGPNQVDGVISRFDKLAKKNDEGFSTSFSWVSGSKVTHGGFTAVAVSYGPIGRVVLFEGGVPAKGVTSLSYMARRAPRILALDSDGLLVASSFVRDAGMRDNTQIDAAKIGLGRARNSCTLTVTKTFAFEHTLDWGGASTKGSNLIVESIDEPQSFFVSESEALLRRHRTYTFVDGTLTLKQDRPGDTALRAVDAWLYQAQKARHPSTVQSKALAVLPERQMLMGHTVTLQNGISTVVLECEEGRLTFTVGKDGKVSNVRPG